MKTVSFKQYAMAAACFFLIPVYAQQAGSGEKKSYTVGQIYDITVEQQNTDLDIVLDVMATDEATNLEIKVKKYKGEKLVFELRESDGTLLQSNTITLPETILNTAPLKAATYTLGLTLEGKTVQRFTIVKN
jgi:hypothetical protein